MRSPGVELRVFPENTIIRKCKNAEGIPKHDFVETGLGPSQRNNKGGSIPPSDCGSPVDSLRFKGRVVLGRAPLNVPFLTPP